MTEHPVIILDPPWWRCENGTEFRSGQSKPSKCPVCGSTEIEIVVEVEPEMKPQNETSRLIAERLAHQFCVEEFTPGSDAETWLSDAIEAALNAERERCAKIAESHRDTAYRLEEEATERRDRVIAAARASLARSITDEIRGSKD